MFGFTQKTETKNTTDSQLDTMKAILDHVDNMVLLCDTSHENNVFYVNQTAKNTFEKYRQEMMHALRGADPSAAQGGSIHRFHQNPERIRRILQQLGSGAKNATHVADIPLGSITLRTKAYPIWDTADPSKVKCYLACWEDITSKIEHEELQNKVASQANELHEQVSYIASTMEEVSTSIDEVAHTTAEASNRGNSAFESAKEGQTVVEGAVRGMRDVAELVHTTAGVISQLNTQSDKIGVIVGVIKDIADQTNLLALNAAIEAARAGDTGRGFAVVADEVRKLSERTAKATAEISELIRSIQVEIEHAVGTMNSGEKDVSAGEEKAISAEKALVRIVQDVGAMRNLISEISNASEQQASSVRDVAQRLEIMTTKP
ncbi:methyl-accepting chemotaxis protein [Iodobacter ciconiae]|uniref:Methyl-accepting chemotaxis protein n=1 Tax=Iodobacter ciconiae TaxID=2496266 RepID=A0A3S8ZX24_9NEIS|nr:methyl-accepting chemotaxis protein [Iodobacter ciconiae]AZN37995.1 methyl-accepting chemotaxis protein [Iodobacter ciconiae]